MRPSRSNPHTSFAHVDRCASPAIGELASMMILHILTHLVLQSGRCKSRAKTLAIQDDREFKKKPKQFLIFFFAHGQVRRLEPSPAHPLGGVSRARSRPLPPRASPPRPPSRLQPAYCPHACMRPMLTCAPPYAPPLPAGGRGSRPWPSCAGLPRLVRHWAAPCPPTNFFLFAFDFFISNRA